LCKLANPTSIYLRDNKLFSNADNAFGINFDQTIKKNSFLQWTLREKCKYPKSILAIQVGEFFEFSGIDALLTVEYAGLRAMGKLPKLKSGTILCSIQRLLDSMVEHGLTVRVYEEFGNNLKTSFKKRRLCQVVSKSNPVYFRALDTIEDDENRECRPLLYVFMHDIMTIDITNRVYTRYFGLSSTSIKSFIFSIRPAEVFCIPHHRAAIPKQYHCDSLNSNDCIDTILHDLKITYDIEEDFVEYKWNSDRIPLMKSTSEQLGICSSIDCIPDLVSSAMGPCSFVERQFMTNWILIKPTKDARSSMENICKDIGDGTISLTNARPLNPNQIFGLLSSGGICKDRSLLPKLSTRLTKVVKSIDVHNVAKEFLGILQTYDVYQLEVSEIQKILDDNICNYELSKDNHIPYEFLCRNEIVIVNVSSIKDIISCKQNVIDYLKGIDNVNIVYSAMDNDIAWTIQDRACQMISATNKKGPRKELYTTTVLKDLLLKYVTACETCYCDQLKVIKDISLLLTRKYAKTLKLFLQGEVIAKCVHRHLVEVISKGWHPAKIETDRMTIDIQGVFPHWLSSNASTVNNITMTSGELVLLTARNAIGKTTIIRSFMISCILAHAGFYVPAFKALLPDINHFFLRIPGSDRPSEGLSSFESEIIDLQQMLEVANEKTVICLDELAMSTSPKEGIAIAHAVIEFLLQRKCYCIFSTHLLDLLDRKLDITNMTIDYRRKYILGRCTTSEAVEVCKKYNMNTNIIERARALLGDCDHQTKSHQSVMQRIQNIAQEITSIDAVHIKLGMLIPPNLTASPCVYLIEQSKDLWYCGESKHIINRQCQHTKKNRIGHIMVFPVQHKSDALTFETLIQRRCIKVGITLSSITDSFHKI
jgi:hypothetical protein